MNILVFNLTTRMTFVFILLFLVSILVLFYFYIQQKYSYWSKRGIQGPTPGLFSFGTVFQIAGRDAHVSELEMLKKYGKVYGTYTGFQPSVSISDAQLIKQIMVKDFHMFVDHRALSTYHEVVNRIIFFDVGDDWKRIRAITSPCFSSGKLKAMYTMMDQSVDKLVGYLSKITKENSGTIPDVKKVMIGFTMDVIASNVFGVETDSNNETRSSSNQFLLNGIRIMNPGIMTSLSFFALPRWFNNLVNIQHPFEVKSWHFFLNLAKEILRQRREGKLNCGLKRNDLIDILIEAEVDEQQLKDGGYEMLSTDGELDDKTEATKPKSTSTFSIKSNSKSSLSETEIIAQAIGFMVGGYDTAAQTLAHCMFELSRNPDVQERLHDEVEKALQDQKSGTIDYFDTVCQIPYLDSVIKETLRKYPPFVFLERTMSGGGPYKLGDTGITLEKGQLIEIPTFAVHYDPEYHPEPDRFNPDRFMPENKHKLVPYSFVPFGHGPRNCLGLRFAIQEMKLCLAKLVRQFKFEPTGQTPKCLKFAPLKPILNAETIEIRIEKRNVQI